VSELQIVPQWAVSAAFNDGTKSSRGHVLDKLQSMKSGYSISENLLLHDFLMSAFDEDYHKQMVSERDESIEKWCFGNE
jgi:hypothetical protein|tara:strand:+ start:400 stop:636 length:237 start_codon:yes stop_codon:yes gene_type:complete